jgi:hypothetical protein
MMSKEKTNMTDLAESGRGKSLREMPGPMMAALLISAMECLALAAMTYGTSDVLFFQSYAVKAAHDGATALYRDGANLVAYHPDHVERMAHPPAMLDLWEAVQYVEKASGIPFRFWFRLLTIIANLVSAVFVWKLATAKAAIFYVLCPAAIMIAGFHGNSDPLIVAALLASVYAAECKGRSALSGVLYGVALSMKVWPLFLILAIMLGLKTWRARFCFGTLALATVAALALPHILTNPRLIISSVFGYRSISGWWGLSLLPSYVHIGVPLTFAAIAVAAVYLRKRNASLSYMTGSSIILFLVLTPGFGVQYLAWVLPFCFLFGNHVVLGVYATSSAFVAVTYTFYSGGIPWYFADALIRHSGFEVVICFGAVCWIVLAASAMTSLRIRGSAMA